MLHNTATLMGINFLIPFFFAKSGAKLTRDLLRKLPEATKMIFLKLQILTLIDFDENWMELNSYLNPFKFKPFLYS